MNKVKKQIQALRFYLGKDQQGIAYLDEITQSVNQMRKDLAAAKEDVGRRESMAVGMKQKVVSSERKIAELTEGVRSRQSEVRQSRQKIANLEAIVAELERVLDPPVVTAEQPRLSGMARFKALFKSLRMRMPRPPTPCIGSQEHKPLYCFELTDIVTEYSEHQYTTLGMFVVTCNLIGWPVGFAAADKTNHPNLKDEWLSGGEPGRFIRWVKEEWIAKEPRWKDDVFLRTRNVSNKPIS